MFNVFKPEHSKTFKTTYLRSAKAQLGLRILVRIFVSHSVGSQGPKESSRGQRRLIRLRGCAGWTESSLDAHCVCRIWLAPAYFFIVLGWLSRKFLRTQTWTKGDMCLEFSPRFTRKNLVQTTKLQYIYESLKCEKRKPNSVPFAVQCFAENNFHICNPLDYHKLFLIF